MMSATLMEKVMAMLTENNMLKLKGSFNSIITKKKKFPYLKLKNDIVFLLMDLLHQEGFDLTYSVKYDSPGCHVSLVLRKEENEIDVESLLLMRNNMRVFDIYVRRLEMFRKSESRMEFLVLQVKIPDLAMLRQNMKLPRRNYDQEVHITLGQRRY